MAIFPWRKKADYSSVEAYNRYLDNCLRRHRNNVDLAYAEAVGSTSVEMFDRQGDLQVEVLRYHGLADGAVVFDLGCGSGRTAQALQRSGWQGTYFGSDIIERFAERVRLQCPGYNAFAHREPTIPMSDSSVDLLFHWSVFTHIPVEECYLYMRDIYRVLKPGGRMVFSFLELVEPQHWPVFESRLGYLEQGRAAPLLDTFLHRDWISQFAARIGFTNPRYTSGAEAVHHPPFWQSLAVLDKPS